MKIVALGEIMMRLSIDSVEHINNANHLDIYFGGGEYNTLVCLSGLNHETEILTTLPNNQLGSRILCDARKYMVGTNYINQIEGRLGTYFTILGNDVVPTQVIYDRADSAFARASDYDIDNALNNIDLFHVSGITPAINNELKELTLKTIKLAKQKGIAVSYDSNYRAKLWTQEDAGLFLKEVLPFVDYVLLGILDMKYLLKMDVNSLEEGYKLLKHMYPNIKYLASTDREVINSRLHKMKINLYDNELYQTEVVDINVVDRIGGGDAFTASILDGILNKKSKEDITSFALATIKLKHISKGDNTFITREEVLNIMNNPSLKITR